MTARYEFALAGAADDAALRRRMAEDVIDGDVAVSFRREPSYFAGCAILGEATEVVKCVDRESGEIVGMGARHFTDAYVNGAPLRVAYLSDLRGAPRVRRGTLLARGFRFFADLQRERPAPLGYTVIFDGNRAALGALTGGRVGLPEYTDLGRLLSPAIFLDLPRRPLAVPGVELARAAAADVDALVGFLNREHARKQFAPVWRRDDLGGRFGGSLRPEDFLLARRGGRIVGALAAWDQSALRQTHVERYAALLAAARPFYNALCAVAPLKPLVPPGAALPFFYVAAIAIEDDDPAVFAALLRRAYRDRRRGPWRFMVPTLHERDPLAAVLDGYRAIAAAGRLFAVRFAGTAGPVLDARVPYVDMARS